VQSGSKVTITEGSDTMDLTASGNKLIYKFTETEEGYTVNGEMHFTKM